MDFPPFSLSGPDFLIFYAAIDLIALISAGVVAHQMATAMKAAMRKQVHGHPGLYEIAYATGGAHRVVAVALQKLTDEGRLQVTPTGWTPSPDIDAPKDGFERAVLNILARDGNPVSAGPELARAAQPFETRATAFALCLPVAAANKILLRGMIPVAIVLPIGLAKLALGISREKPVGFLVMMLFGLALTAFIVVMIIAYWHTRLRISPNSPETRDLRSHIADTVPASGTCATIAFCGASVMGADMLAHYRKMYPGGDSAGGDGGGGDSGGCSGGDGGGCGGCSS